MAEIHDGMGGQLVSTLAMIRGGEAPMQEVEAALREALPDMVAQMFGGGDGDEGDGPRPGPTQCHDITLYPEIGLAGGACEGYGLLIDITDPVNPKRIAAVADSNFSYWHSATFNNEGTSILFSDEWGGGGGPNDCSTTSTWPGSWTTVWPAFPRACAARCW